MRPSNVRASIVILCLLGLFAIFSSTMSKSPILPYFARDLGASEVELGIIAAASTIPGIIASFPAGLASDIWAKRILLIVSCLFFALTPFLYFLVRTPLQLTLVRFAHGFATAILGPVALAMVARKYLSRRGEMMGYYSSSTYIGRLAAPVAGGAILSSSIVFVAGTSTFMSIYLICGISGFLALLFALLIPHKNSSQIEPDAAMRPRNLTRSLRELFTNRLIMTTAVMEAVQYFSFGAIEFFLPLFWSDKLGLDETQIGIQMGIMLTTIVAVLLLTNPLMGRLSDRFSRKPFIYSGLFICGLSLILLPLIPDLLTGGILVALYGLGMSANTASTSAFISDLAKKEQYGAAIGITKTIMDIGQALGPITFGIVLTITIRNYLIGFLFVSSVLFLAVALFLGVVRTTKAKAVSNSENNIDAD
ncbi:MAG: MFS transporter [Promethearchaeota archaeon]